MTWRWLFTTLFPTLPFHTPFALQFTLVLAIAAASSNLNLLGLSGVVVAGSQAKVDLHLGDLLNGELRQLLGDLEWPLLIDVGLGEDDINLFQITTGGLNVEEVGEGNGAEID